MRRRRRCLRRHCCGCGSSSAGQPWSRLQPSTLAPLSAAAAHASMRSPCSGRAVSSTSSTVHHQQHCAAAVALAMVPRLPGGCLLLLLLTGGRRPALWCAAVVARRVAPSITTLGTNKRRSSLPPRCKSHAAGVAPRRPRRGRLSAGERRPASGSAGIRFSITFQLPVSGCCTPRSRRSGCVTGAAARQPRSRGGMKRACQAVPALFKFSVTSLLPLIRDYVAACCNSCAPEVAASPPRTPVDHSCRPPYGRRIAQTRKFTARKSWCGK